MYKRQDGHRAAALSVAVGLRRLGGFLHGGMTSWRQERRPTEAIERVPLEALPARAADVQILDVREEDEWRAGHIPGSTFKPWHDIAALPEGLDPSAPIAVMCASGQRAATAASLIQRHGARHVLHVVDGGVGTWGRLGHPIETAADPTGAAA